MQAREVAGIDPVSLHASINIRVWFDGDPPTLFRASLIEVIDSLTPERRVSATVNQTIYRSCADLDSQPGIPLTNK